MNFDDVSKEYAIAIKKECNLREIPIGDLERGIGLSLGYISRCRRGLKHMSIDSIEAASKFLNVDFINRIHYKEKEKDE